MKGKIYESDEVNTLDSVIEALNKHDVSVFEMMLHDMSVPPIIKPSKHVFNSVLDDLKRTPAKKL